MFTGQSDSNKNAVFNGNTKTNSDAIFRTSQVKLCGDEWQEGAPAYVFWQVDFDAARISYCGWYLKEVIATNPPDLRQLTTILQRLSAVPGSPPLWSLPQGPPGAGQAGIPSIQNFQMVDAMMTLAVSQFDPRLLVYIKLVLTFGSAAHAYKGGGLQKIYTAGQNSLYVLC